MKSRLSMLIAAGFALGAEASSPAHLEQALQQVPVAAVEKSDGVLMEFVDIQALRNLGTELQGDGLRRTATLAPIQPLQSLYAVNESTWHDKAGIGLGDVRYFAGYGSPPDAVSIWAFSEASVGKVLLKSKAFAPLPAGQGVLSNGSLMQMDHSRAEPGNPWFSDMGYASAVVLRGNVLLQSWSERPLQIATSPHALTLPGAKALLAGLPGEGTLVRALLLSPGVGLNGPEPAVWRVVDPDLKAVKQAIEEEARDGIAPYSLGLIADRQLGEQAELTIVLAYPDCQIAEQAAKQIVERWQPESGSHADTASVAGHGSCAAVVRIRPPKEKQTGASPNPYYDSSLRQIASRDFRLLKIRLRQ